MQVSACERPAPPNDSAGSFCRVAPSTGWVSLNLNELWGYRELLYFLIWRDIKVRYKQTVLGAAWAIIQPLFTMLVFSSFFGHLAKMPSDGVPYPLFSYAALVPWMFFANGLNQATGSLVGSAGLITKVYFPRLALPIAKVVSGVLDLILSFAVLVGIMLYYGNVPTLYLTFLPMFAVLALAAALGVGLWLSALNVQFRDIGYLVPFLVQFWLFCTPIAYPSTLVPKPWRSFYYINPMVGVVEGFRWALFGSRAGTEPAALILVSAPVTIGLLLSGAYYFRRVERSFADVV